ncbi:conserved hypothetical protein [Burkholderia vietnamiensis]|nr:conserved hypothetical protein [Burkholderia vietnamiensis]SOT46024.1 hypothetical protein F01_570010 [Burkholderia cenocepacia]
MCCRSWLWSPYWRSGRDFGNPAWKGLRRQRRPLRQVLQRQLPSLTDRSVHKSSDWHG